MPLILGKRNDAAAKEQKRRSILSAIDEALLVLHNRWLDTHFAAETVASCRAKLDRLDALLDDPDLAAAYPDGHPDRLDALDRYHELHHEKNRATADFRRAAKATAKAWGELPDETERANYGAVVAREWRDSAAFGLALTDIGLNRDAFWVEMLRLNAAHEGETVEMPPCPY